MHAVKGIRGLKLNRKDSYETHYNLTYLSIVSVTGCRQYNKKAAGLTYIIHTKNTGFEADIVREAFALEGYTVQFVYQPLIRTKLTFQHGTVDGVMTIQTHYPEIQNSFVSEEYITYHNFAVTLESRNISINAISDLKNKKINAFQQARFALGKLMFDSCRYIFRNFREYP